MKKYIAPVLKLVFVVALTGCLSSADGTDNLPKLDEIADLTQEQLDEKLTGLSQGDVHNSWGEPDGMLSGFWGDIYHVPDHCESIILYYDADGIVETIKVDNRNNTE